MKLTFLLLYSFILGISVVNAQAITSSQKDSSVVNTPVKNGISKADSASKKKPIKLPYMHQMRFSIDMASIATDFLYSDKKSFEVQFDYKLRKTNYFVVETGYGTNKVTYTNLNYSNKNGYIRLGIDKNVLDVISPKDFDIFFIGVRLGMGLGNRSDVSFLVPSYFGPPIEGSKPTQSYFLYWGEINTGMRVELLKNFFLGWNVRLKVLLNSGVFSELAPSFVPGYGKGDQSTSLGANIYVCYALRWMGK